MPKAPLPFGAPKRRRSAPIQHAHKPRIQAPKPPSPGSRPSARTPAKRYGLPNNFFSKANISFGVGLALTINEAIFRSLSAERPYLLGFILAMMGIPTLMKAEVFRKRIAQELAKDNGK